ncbi:LexA family transcriptional regulator [Ascidiimonas aurantiaca]|uniref:XRE family transcriptional regulator n=1 Tax=Ascidiimonas aurantiaca TaxID=1685432 RepID=UPI0030EE36EF
MEEGVNIEAKRFKEIRESKGYTQQGFAKALGIGSSTADIERGKTRVPGKAVMELLHRFKVNPMWLFGESSQRYIQSLHNVSPKVVSVGPEDTENTVMVSVKAAAGYPANIQDVEWFEQLPAFSIPLPQFRNATFRGFEVEGDSMLPSLQPGEWVIGRAVNSIDEVNDHSVCVVVMNDSVLVKKVQKLQDPSKLVLISLNEFYPPFTIEVSDILELWQVNSKISFDIDTSPSQHLALNQLQRSVETLKKEIQRLKD